MLRRSILSCCLALAAILALAMPALAGGVVVSLDGTPADVQAGVPFEVGFTIFSAHDGSPQAGMDPILTATNPATGESLKVSARPQGAGGHYVASLTLPTAGEWQWEIQPYGNFMEDYPASVFTPIQVSAPAAAQPAANPQVAAQPALDLSPVAVLVGAGVVILIAGAALVLNRRRAAVRA
jgi:hypothetical protein